MQNKDTKKRENNFELLRILAMIMILVLHFNGHGKVLNNVETGSIEFYIAYFLEYACIIAVNVYVMITGYYMVKSRIKISKLIRLELEIIFYSVGINIVLILCNKCNINMSMIIKSFFPIITKQYWFMSAYMGLYLLIPFINKFINSINKKDYKILLIILTIFLSFIKTIYSKNNVFESNGGYGLFWFIYLYMLAGYIRIHYKSEISNYKLFVIYFSMIVLQLLIRCINLKINISVINLYVECSLQYNSLFILIESLAIFLLFKNISIKNKVINKIIEKIAPFTLGVYLIHEQPILRSVLWSNIIKPVSYINSGFSIIFILIIDVILIFTACCIIESLRSALFKQLEKTNIIKQTTKRLEKLNETLNIK